MWGDGGGTSMGGSTFVVPDGPLKMWKGRWSAFVFKFFSKWKELLTLKLSLLWIRKDDFEAVCGAAVFCFTNNETSCWIAVSGLPASPGLHKLIEEIRLLKLKLDCSLQAIHVSGLIIKKGLKIADASLIRRSSSLFVLIDCRWNPMSRATTSLSVMFTAPLGVLGLALTGSLCGFCPPNWLVKFSSSCWKPKLRGPLLHQVTSSSLAQSLHSGGDSGGDCCAISLNVPLSILTSLLCNIPQCLPFQSLFCICLLTCILLLHW
jgi:hypothetical protein